MKEFQRGKYIVFEGGEYAGKSTQAALLAPAIGARIVREPGTTHAGEVIRNLLLDSRIPKQVETEVLLHAAQRAELIGTIVNPALKNGEHVISDRSWLSSAAYQGAGGVEYRRIETINRFATQGRLVPDMVIVLDGDPRDLAARATGNPDYYEGKDLNYHDRVRENFLSLAKTIGGTVIDALQPVDTVAGQIRRAVLEHL